MNQENKEKEINWKETRLHIHNITSWGYYLIGERLCHGTHGLPCAFLQKQDLSFFWIYQKSFYDQSR